MLLVLTLLLSQDDPGPPRDDDDAGPPPRDSDSDANACDNYASFVTEPHVGKMRIRRAAQVLTDEEWQRVVDAFWVMRTTDTLTGQEIYGGAYFDYEYFVLRHMVSSVCIASLDRDSDTTGHDLFMVWHSVQLLEFENALLAVDPRIDGLPYLDYIWMAAAFQEGGDEEYALFSKRFGSFEGLRPVGSDTPLAVPTDGSFANWPVLNWSDVSVGGMDVLLATQPAGLRAAFGVGAHWDETEARTMSFGQVRNCTYNDFPNLTMAVPYLLRELNADFPYHSEEFELLESACEQKDHMERWTGENEAGDSISFNGMSMCLEGKVTHDWEVEVDKIRSKYADTADYTPVVDCGDDSPDFPHCVWNPHEFVHQFFGGDMASGPPAVIDPVFFFHHSYFDRMRVSWHVAHPELRQSAWGIRSDFLGIPLGHTSDTNWQEHESQPFETAYAMAWDKHVIWGTKNASEIDLSVGTPEMLDAGVLNPQIMTVQDAMCSVLVPGVFYWYDEVGSVDWAKYDSSLVNHDGSKSAVAVVMLGGLLGVVMVRSLLFARAKRSQYQDDGNSMPPMTQKYDLQLNDAAKKSAMEEQEREAEAIRVRAI